MNEKDFALQIKDFLEKELNDKYLVHSGKSLLYKLEIDTNGQLKPKDIFNPTRGQYAFETDILIESKKLNIPLVVVELKFGGFSTHDIITYSAKASKHKDIYPYLRYGFIVGDSEFITGKFLTHNQAVDFSMTIKDFASDKLDFLALIKRQVDNAEKLIDALKDNRVNIKQYEENIVINKITTKFKKTTYKISFGRNESINAVVNELEKKGFDPSIIRRSRGRGANILCTNAEKTKEAYILVVRSQKRGQTPWAFNHGRTKDYCSDVSFYVFVRYTFTGDSLEFFIVPSKVVAEYIKEPAEKWLKTHEDTGSRKFADIERIYLNRWDLLGLEPKTS